MGISDYLAGLRARVGHDLILVPTATALPWDDDGRLLLVRHLDTGQWATIGGAIDPDEDPAVAARREAAEEANIEVEVTLRTALGGPDYRITYPNGDRVSCVAIVFDARIVSGDPRPDHDETCEVGWFEPSQVLDLDLDGINRALLGEVLDLRP